MLINQPTLAPNRKVAAGGIAGVITVAAVQLLNLYLPGYSGLLSPLVEQIVPVIIGFVAAYMTKARA